MIPILYEKDETTFASNGLGRLRDVTSCIVTEERNGIYECDFEMPIDGAHFNDVQIGRIIAVEHDETNDVQPFDIVSYSRPINGLVSFHATHISYRQSKMTASGTNINSLSGAFSMLRNATPSNPFTYWTDKTGNAYMSSADGVPRSVRQFLGGVEGSILDTYGGEYEWDKFNVKLWAQRGEDRTFTIRYGVNMLDYTDETDYSESHNAVVPYWAGEDATGKLLVVKGSMIESGIGSYSGRTECIPVDFTDKFENKPTVAQLESFARTYLASSQPYLPAQTISIDFIRLTDTEEYAKYAKLQECKLCDTVRVIFPNYDQAGRYKIVKTQYDVLRERFTSLELGDLSTTLSEALGVGGGSSPSNGGGADYINLFYPVGSYYETSDSAFDPNVSWGGTWVLEESGRVHVSAGTGYAIGAKGGNKDAVIPYHRHSVSAVSDAITGGSHKHNLSERNNSGTSTMYALVTESGKYANGGARIATSTHTHDLPAHNTNYAGTSGNATNANMQPYIVVNRWHRTA